MKPLSCLAIAAAVLLLAVPLSAGTFVTNSTADSHDVNPGDGICGDHIDVVSSHCTVRAAIEEANAIPGPDTIVVTASEIPHILAFGTLTVTDNGTAIRGESGTSMLDGLNNPFGAPILDLLSDSNSVTGMSFQRSRGDALVVSGSFNVIGGGSSEEGNRFVNNGLDLPDSYALRISGKSASGNLILHNFIGMTGNGTEPFGNSNGIAIDNEAHDNVVGRASSAWANLISGNKGYGVLISGGAHDNEILGNVIGADITGTRVAPNGSGGILVRSGAHDNMIGNQIDSSGNIISGNDGNGITVTGSTTTENYVCRNLIGPDITGLLPLANGGDGVRIENGAHSNYIGGCVVSSGNIISGNRGSGIRLTGTGTSQNQISHNWIGPDIRGFGGFSSGQDNSNGIYLGEGASENIVGGTMADRNVISGNNYCGVLLTSTGTNANRISGNFIGTSTAGSSTLENGCGVMIQNGASHNVVGGNAMTEGNVISGNRGLLFPYGAGVAIYDEGTNYNQVTGNKIGTDSTGTRAVRNGSAGIIIGAGAQHNQVGGTSLAERNLISGNGSGAIVPSLGRGVHLFGNGTSFNQIIGNAIGLSSTGSVLANAGNGIALVDGATDNQVGGSDDTYGNAIAFNRGHAVYLADTGTFDNSIRHNSMYTNDSLGIAIRRSAQRSITAPSILVMDNDTVTGIGAPPLGVVDLYLAASDPSGRGEGKKWLATTTADINGSFKMTAAGLGSVDTLTAQATDIEGNSSEFSINVPVGQVTDISDEGGELPAAFRLEQNYPNPFNASTQIAYSLPSAGLVELKIYNIVGQLLATLVSTPQSAGNHVAVWDGRNDAGIVVSSGVYWYRLTTADRTESRKMLLLK
ncbi:MAG: T9SS type A sorting domain-containing protein [Candidatus Zixiibacteriota bacterium]